MPTTEIATLSLKPGSDIGDPTNDASRVVNECGNVLVRQPGLLALRLGPVVEDPNKMQMFIEWETKQRHEDFIASEAYGPFLGKFKTIMAGPASFMHIDFEGDMEGAFKAPVTEVATFYFNDRPDPWTQGVHDFIKTCLDANPGIKFHGYATGPTQEELEYNGVKGKAGVLIIGWESVEQHMEFRKMEVFQQNAQKMRQNAPGIEVHHTTVMNFVAS